MYFFSPKAGPTCLVLVRGLEIRSVFLVPHDPNRERGETALGVDRFDSGSSSFPIKSNSAII